MFPLIDLGIDISEEKTKEKPCIDWVEIAEIAERKTLLSGWNLV
jgi:hypothetical protein